MRLLNRTAISIVGARPYVEWMRRIDGDRNKGTLTVARAHLYGTAFLLPEFELEEDIQEWVEENASWLFEFQLAAWTVDETVWPVNRNLKMFREWFRIDIHSAVVDEGDGDIRGEEL